MLSSVFGCDDYTYDHVKLAGHLISCEEHESNVILHSECSKMAILTVMSEARQLQSLLFHRCSLLCLEFMGISCSMNLSRCCG